MSEKMLIGYWKIRGLIQPVRTMMAYSKADYELKEYRAPLDRDGNFEDLDGWFTSKHSLGLTYPNLPYLIQGELKLTESNAIFGYLGEKYNLHGTTPKERAQVVMHAEVVMAFRNEFVKLVYQDKPNYQENKKKYFDKQLAANKNAHFFLGLFELALDEKQWLLGEKLTFPDFHLYEMIFAHSKCNGDETLTDYPNVIAFRDRFLALPGIAEIENETKHLNINGSMSSFPGGE